VLVEAQFSGKDREPFDRAVDRPCTNMHRGSNGRPLRGSSGKQIAIDRPVDRL